MESQSSNDSKGKENLILTSTGDIELLEDYFRIVVHDIATPIMINELALGMIRKKLRAKTFESMAPDVERASEASKHVMSIVNRAKNILVSRGQIASLVFEVVDMQACCLETIHGLTSIFDLKDIRIKLHMAEENLKINCDPFIMKTVILGNLLSNACKFSSKGSEVLVGLFSEGSEVVLEIQDAGVGIEAEVIEKILKGKSMASTVGTAGETGTGLGLALVKRFCERMGGKLSIVSVPSNENKGFTGTNFRIAFPQYVEN